MTQDVASPAEAAAGKTLPDRIADELIARIFAGELQPGDSLPPERALAEQLGVDRTSLRMALRQLTRMKVVRATRGSGVIVLDYRRHAGIDFLAAVLEVPGLSLGGAFLIEMLDHWIAAMPAVTGLAFARATPADIRALDRRFAEQLRLLDAGAELDAILEIELDIQDAIIALAGSTVLDLVANSTRALRRELGRLLLQRIDVRAQVEKQRAQLRAVLRGTPGSAEQIAAHRRMLIEHNAQLRSHLASLPPSPSRGTRWPAPRHARARPRRRGGDS